MRIEIYFTYCDNSLFYQSVKKDNTWLFKKNIANKVKEEVSFLLNDSFCKKDYKIIKLTGKEAGVKVSSKNIEIIKYCHDIINPHLLIKFGV